MGWQQVANGDLFEAGSISNIIDNQVPSGEKVRLGIYLRFSPPQYMVNDIQSRLEDAGVQEVQVSTGSPLLNISWRKPSVIQGVGQELFSTTTLVIIGIILLLVAVIMIIGWAIFREVGPTASTFLAVAAAGLTIFGIIALAKRRG